MAGYLIAVTFKHGGTGTLVYRAFAYPHVIASP